MLICTDGMHFEFFLKEMAKRDSDSLICTEVRGQLKSTILALHYFMDDCDFLKCKVAVSATHGNCSVSYEKIESQLIIRIIYS